jgi:transposase
VQRPTSTVVIDQDYIRISKSEYEHLLSNYQNMELQLAELKRLIFGSKSERFIGSETTQLGLFADQKVSEVIPQTEQLSYSRAKTKTKQIPVRALLPAHLARVEETIEPDNLGQGVIKIGEQITEILEYNPAKVFVRKIIRPKYALKDKTGVLIANLPSLPLPKANAGAGLLAHILVSKYVDHLPFYRQRQIFKRQDLQLSDSTLSGWFNATATLLEPLYHCLERQLLQSNYLQADESPIGVQDSHKKGRLHTGYHWVYHAPVEGLVLFKYNKSRSAKSPEEFLQDFNGTLQTDGYKVYQNLKIKGGIELLSCMAHARRYFEKALDNDHSRASYALEQIQMLYAIEAKSKDRKLNPDFTKRYRKLYAKPILEQLHKWMIEQLQQVLPKSSIAKAIAYSLRLWDKLIAYTNDGNYAIDNNLIENTIRPLALGRKNYLFAGSHKATQKAAMMYSFFACCKINDVEPYAWLKDTLERIPDYKANKLEELLPHNYKQNLSVDPC